MGVLGDGVAEGWIGVPTSPPMPAAGGLTRVLISPLVKSVNGCAGVGGSLLVVDTGKDDSSLISPDPEFAPLVAEDLTSAEEGLSGVDPNPDTLVLEWDPVLDEESCSAELGL